MGNTASYSCFSVSIRTKTATLLDTRGNVREVKLPMRSGEIMIEQLGHVITPLDDLRRTRRISALQADEELLAGKVYLLAPLNRVNCKASEFEMEMVERWSLRKKKINSSGNKAKVSPLSGTDGEFEVNGLQVEGNVVGTVTPCHRRRWSPVLQPILEYSREF